MAPKAADAPAGTRFVPALSHEITETHLIEFLAGQGASPASLEFFGGLDFAAGQAVAFRRPHDARNRADGRGTGASVILLLFESAQGASTFQEWSRSNALLAHPGAELSDAAHLGETAYQLTRPGGSGFRQVAWRRHNVAIGVTAYGMLSLREVGDLVATIERRAIEIGEGAPSAS